MTARLALLVLLACAVGCWSFGPVPPGQPPHHAWALSDPSTPIPGETPRTRRIAEAALAFEIPSGDWPRRGHWVSGAEAVLYTFKRQEDGPGRRPAMLFLVEHVGPGFKSVDEFVAAKRRQLPPHVIERALGPDEVGLPGAIGFRVHSDDAGGAHTQFIVYALHRELGIVVFMDAPTPRFSAIEPEYRAALRSLRYYR